LEIDKVNFILNRKERLQKELESLRSKECYLHGDTLVRSITEPSYGYPSEQVMVAKQKFPFHGLFVEMGCIASPSDERQGQKTLMCPSCNNEARKYFKNLEQ
jgi:hypothetical protein